MVTFWTYAGESGTTLSFKISVNMFKTCTDFCWPFILWIFYYVSCLSLLSCLVCTLQPCGHIIGRAGLFASLWVVLSCVFVTFLIGFLCQGFDS